MKLNIDNPYDASHFWDLPNDDDAVKNDFFELKCTVDGENDTRIPRLLSIVEVPVCACHYPGAEKFPWWLGASKVAESDNPELWNVYHYFEENGLLAYNGKILLETPEELHTFLERMLPYPETARYLDIYLFCRNGVVLQINHHSTVFVYSCLE